MAVIQTERFILTRNFAQIIIQGNTIISEHFVQIGSLERTAAIQTDRAGNFFYL